MVGVTLLISLFLLGFHWYYVMPRTRAKYPDELGSCSFEYFQTGLFGSVLCMFPPLYLLGILFIYIKQKGEERYEKLNSNDTTCK